MYAYISFQEFSANERDATKKAPNLRMGVPKDQNSGCSGCIGQWPRRYVAVAAIHIAA